MGKGPFSNLGSNLGVQPKQLILEPKHQGISGNGIATISPDNSFNLVAYLPTPTSLMGYGSHTYAVYMVDSKKRSGFLAGILRPVGNGVYQTQFQSPVPLVHYDKVIVSVENPMRLGQSPNGPVVLGVKESLTVAAFLGPLKTVGGGIWRRVSGLFQKKSVPEVPLQEQIVPPQTPQTSQSSQVPTQQTIPTSPGAGVQTTPIPPTGTAAPLPSSAASIEPNAPSPPMK